MADAGRVLRGPLSAITRTVIAKGLTRVIGWTQESRGEEEPMEPVLPLTRNEKRLLEESLDKAFNSLSDARNAILVRGVWIDADGAMTSYRDVIVECATARAIIMRALKEAEWYAV